ncbi:MAG: MarR family transcriptional regulator [Candidatus Firestonebacteria bacterium]
MRNSEFNSKIESVSKVFPDLLKHLQTLTYQALPIGDTKEEQLCAELSLSQMKTLSVFICEDKPLKMSDVAKKLNVTLPTVTQIVDKLVSLELLERVRNEEDRRLVIVSITEKGKRLVRMSQERRIESFKWWLEKLSLKEQMELVATLEKLNEILERIKKIEREEKLARKI